MAPAYGAQDPTSSRNRPQHHVRSKQISLSPHDDREPTDGGPATAPGHSSHPNPNNNQQGGIAPRLTKLLPSTPSDPANLRQIPQRSRTFSSTTAVSESNTTASNTTATPSTASPTATNTTPGKRIHSSASSPSIQDAVRPVLSERDSIFAEHYLPSEGRALNTIHSTGRNPAEARSSSEDGNDGRSGRDKHLPVMAASPIRRNHSQLDFASGLHLKDLPPSTISLLPHHSLALQQHIPRHHRPSRISFPLSPHRRSLYDIHDLGSVPIANLLQNITTHDLALPRTPLRANELPATPSSTTDTSGDVTDLDQSAERQKYRSWRKGQAKMTGMTIKESQRTPGKAEPDVDKVIDAQLPQPDLPIANARSRKASHYLGLFRENEAEERREHEKKKGGKSKDASSESHPLRPKKVESLEPTIAEDVEAIEDSNEVTVSQERMTKKLPLGLLEEIRNHEQLAPKLSRKDSQLKQAQHRDLQKLSREEGEKGGKSEDEESDREHISSATYFPHQHTLADSPTDDQVAQRKPQVEPCPESVPADGTSNDVRLSLQYENSRDFLLGASEFKLPEPALSEPELPPTPSDSEYESDYGFDSGVSGTDVDEADTTPTATPNARSHYQPRPAGRKHSHHAPAPVNAVELKPYKHQVGGHTAIYRFSRRAVCKQLNSKENKFYETVEQHHRELLGFMPRYIGVLNVTYRKDQKKRKPTSSDGGANADAADEKHGDDKAKDAKSEKPSEEIRMISHSMQIPSARPQVKFENNRHLIPEHLFRIPHRPLTPELTRTRSSPPRRGTESDDEANYDSSRRPTLKPGSSWGFTSVNADLRDRILREVFTPPVIHRHDKRDRHQLARSARRFPKHTHDEVLRQQRQNSVDVSSLQRFKDSESKAPVPAYRSRLQATHSDLGGGAGSDIEQVLKRSALSKSAETSDADLALPAPAGRHHRRRHSGGGLRKATDIEGNHGDLEFHEDDDDAYTADAEEDVFSMDDVKRLASKPEAHLKHSKVAPVQSPQSEGSPEDNMAHRLGPAINFGSPEPRNPETSLVQHDERVERFLLLEDLTSGMQKPCVLDLKMGTRQYGIEANEKKQASQRMKCKTTTSRKLGVRVCGMQVYNVREQKYNFEDKYYGRDLKAGLEFEGALKRFFFDGIGHAQALKHIPSVLDKIDQLDRIIRDLPGYRLYASSLLMIYDRGDADPQGKVPDAKDEYGRPAQYPDIKLKIVDFANCVTAEDMERVLRKPCPPRDPESIDRGYVRGLRTLKAYFQKIYQELAATRFVERGEGEGMAIDQRGISGGLARKGWTDSVIDDPGEVSV